MPPATELSRLRRLLVKEAAAYPNDDSRLWAIFPVRVDRLTHGLEQFGWPLSRDEVHDVLILARQHRGDEQLTAEEPELLTGSVQATGEVIQIRLGVIEASLLETLSH